MAIGSPQPSVVHLVTMFRQISAGDIRIPAFQRDFVWKEKQMLELLESVVEGFPIGSILLWGVDAPMLKIAPTELTSFPNVPEHFPTSYVLDGMQRLSTLYGVFHFGTSNKDKRFDVHYELEEERFFHRDGEEISASSIPLAAIFTPRQLLEHQARLSSLDAADTYIERLLQLQSAFQEYMIPIVTIRSSDVARIVGIFEKINSTGTRLDPVDFMRAITWAEDFDLNQALDQSAAILGEAGIAIDSETIVKCVGMTLNIPPTTDGLLQLRGRTPREMTSAFEAAREGLRTVATFLNDHLHIKSTDLIPYEGQLLLIFKAVGMGEASSNDFDGILRWFWATGFNESLRGKPDHYVVRSVENWRGLIAGTIRGLEPRLKLSARDLLERRLVAGRALSSTFVSLHAANQARNIQTGEVIDTDTFMSSNTLERFTSIFSREELLIGGFQGLVSSRILGNVILLDDRSIHLQGDDLRNALLQRADRGDWETLASQFMDNEAIDYLVAGNCRNFVSRRVQLMFEKALQLVGQ